MATAAHELRNSATALAGLAQTLAERDAIIDPHDRKQLLDGLRHAAAWTRTLCTSLLDSSDLVLDEATEGLPGIALAQLVDDVVKAAPPPQGKRLVTDIQEGIRARIDPVALQIVIMNLIRNAYTYGGSTISVRGGMTGSDVTLTVLDDGPGLPADVVTRLFERSNGERSSGDGWGLGLWICHRFVESAGGSLRYERSREHGTRFVIGLSPA